MTARIFNIKIQIIAAVQVKPMMQQLEIHFEIEIFITIVVTMQINLSLVHDQSSETDTGHEEIIDQFLIHQ